MSAPTKANPEPRLVLAGNELDQLRLVADQALILARSLETEGDSRSENVARDLADRLHQIAQRLAGAVAP